jgi:AcrR family transcriptional regulator
MKKRSKLDVAERDEQQRKISKKMPPSLIVKLSRKDDLTAAALDVFGEQGYQTASMREIAHRAGVTQAAIYYHFRCKEDILFALIETFTEEMLSTLMKILVESTSPSEKLRKLIQAHVSLIVGRRKHLKILIEDKTHLSPDRLRMIRQKERTIFTIYRSCIEEMRKSGELSAVDPSIAAFCILGMSNWIYQWFRDDGPLKLDEIVDSMLTFALHGLQAGDGEAATR